jgi:hypothetical protein
MALKIMGTFFEETSPPSGKTSKGQLDANLPLRSYYSCREKILDVLPV